MEEEEDEETEPEDEEEDVFAYHRPQTGQTPAAGRLLVFGGSQLNSSAPPTVSSASSTPLTRGTPASVPLEQQSSTPLSETSTFAFNPSSRDGTLAPPTAASSRMGSALSADQYQASQVSFATSARSGRPETDERGPMGESYNMSSFAPLVTSPYRSDDGQSRAVSASRRSSSHAGMWNSAPPSVDHRRSHIESSFDEEVERKPSGTYDDFEKSVRLFCSRADRSVRRLTPFSHSSFRNEVEADMFEDDSPYEEVRASVSNMDDPEMPGTALRPRMPVSRFWQLTSATALTFRVWVIGIFLSISIASINTFLYFRANSPSIPAVLVLCVSVNPAG